MLVKLYCAASLERCNFINDNRRNTYQRQQEFYEHGVRSKSKLFVTARYTNKRNDLYVTRVLIDAVRTFFACTPGRLLCKTVHSYPGV